jgi:hypothetical protein
MSARRALLKMSARRALLKMSARRALLKMGARRAPKIIGARRAPKNNGCARTHFFRRAFHELISFMSTLQLLFACLPLNNECLCPF